MQSLRYHVAHSSIEYYTEEELSNLKEINNKIKSALATIGKGCFVKYYEYFLDGDYTNKELVEILQNNEGYNNKSSIVRVSRSRQLIKEKLSRKAFELIVNANVEESVKSRARELLSNSLSKSSSEVYVFTPGHKKKRLSTTRKNQSETSLVNLEHNKIQELLYVTLCSKFGAQNVATELAISSKRRIDAVVRLPSEDYELYEIKTAATLRLVVREALGQLLEYAHLDSEINVSKFIIVSYHKVTDEVQAYLDKLNDLYNLNLNYQQVEMSACNI